MILGSVVSGALSYLGGVAAKKVLSNTASTNKTSTTKWVPEGPSILTLLWMLTFLPLGTKLQFKNHHFTHILPSNGQGLTRFFCGDGREELVKLIKAVYLATFITPPIPKLKIKEGDKIPAVNEHYEGAINGLLTLSHTYGWKIERGATNKDEMKDSVYKVFADIDIEKDPQDAAASDAIEECIRILDNALSRGVKERKLSPLSLMVKDNWVPLDFETLSREVKKASEKQKKRDPKDIVCDKEINLLMHHIENKVSDYEGYIKKLGDQNLEFKEPGTHLAVEERKDSVSDGLPPEQKDPLIEDKEPAAKLEPTSSSDGMPALEGNNNPLTPDSKELYEPDPLVTKDSEPNAA